MTKSQNCVDESPKFDVNKLFPTTKTKQEWRKEHFIHFLLKNNSFDKKAHITFRNVDRKTQFYAKEAEKIEV